MKKGHIIFLSMFFLASVVALSGCGKSNSSADKQNEDINLVAQYIANKVISNNSSGNATSGDASTTQVVSDDATTTEEQQKEAKENKNNSNNSTKSSVSKSGSLNDVYKSHNLNVRYKSYKVVSTYDDKNSVTASVSAPKGKKLLVVKLAIKNASGRKIKIDMMNKPIKYLLSGSKSSTQPMLTLLDNDFSVYMHTLNVNEKKNVVLIFPVSKQDTGSKSLKISNGVKTSTIKF